MGCRGLYPLWVLTIFLGFIFLFIRLVEKRSIFFPEKEHEFLPQDFGLGYEEISFRAADGTLLNGWFLPAADARYSVLFCHGNAGNISHRLEKAVLLHKLGCNVFLFDYRGYGKSQGRPSEKGFYLDAQAAYDYLLSRKISPQALIGYGESIGGIVVINLAAKSKCAGIIVEGSFNRAKDMAKRIYPFVPFWAFASRWDGEAKIKSVDAPKLFIHSFNDEIVPFTLARRLYDAAGGSKELVGARGSHNSCFFESEPLIKEKISHFLLKLAQ